jgi:drug/metabolite transporter (DMT)-like permease
MRSVLQEARSSLERRGDAGVYGILILQSFMASGTHLVAKIVVQAVDAFTLTLVRSFVAAAGIGLVMLIRGRMPSVRREDYRLIFFLSLLVIPINQFFFLYGMRFTTPSNAALLYATTPILVLLFSHWFLGEQLTRKKIYGVVLGFIGVTLVIFERGLDAGMHYLMGNLIISLAVLAWGLYTVYGRKLTSKYGPLDASAITLLTGTVLFLPIGIIPALSFPYSSLTPANWLQILYLGIVTSVIAYLLWYYALSRIEAAKVALFANLQPILTTLMAVLLLGQDLTPLFVIGGIVAICGVVLAQFG